MGSKHFRLHCLHCHGLTGDGRGPSGKWLNPHPRDYRQGLFKFQSVNQAADGTIRPPRAPISIGRFTRALMARPCPPSISIRKRTRTLW